MTAEDTPVQQVQLKQFRYVLRGLSTKPDYRQSRTIEARTELEALGIAEANARALADKWRMPVEVLSNGKALTMLWPRS